MRVHELLTQSQFGRESWSNQHDPIKLESFLTTIPNDRQLLYLSLSLSVAFFLYPCLYQITSHQIEIMEHVKSRLIAGSRAHPARSCVGVATSRSTPARACADGGGRLRDASRRRLAVGDATSARQDRTVGLREVAGIMPVSTHTTASAD